MKRGRSPAMEGGSAFRYIRRSGDLKRSAIWSFEDVRLLVVEDDSVLERALEVGLASQGFAVDSARSAEEASDRLAVNEYDLIVLDFGLPGEDGLGFLKRLRARGDSTPVLVLTARGGVASRVEGLDAGADDYLDKPFAFVELVARVRVLLRRGEAYVPPVVRLGALEVDTARRAASFAGTPLNLTIKELAILEYLVRHENRLVSRTMLLEHCWDEGYDGVSNLVDVHVSRVRRKLEALGGQNWIRTVRGAGFMLHSTRSSP